MGFRYDVALSFAGEDRPYVEKVATALKTAGLAVFYDAYEEAGLWGKDLFEHLFSVYKDQARHVIIFGSEAYARKVWTTHERRAAQARALEQAEYILPVRMDDTEIPGLGPTVGYVDGRVESPDRVADLFLEKTGSDSSNTGEALHSITTRSREEEEERTAFLEAFGVFDGPISVAEVARRLELSSSRSHRIITRLLEEGILRVHRKPGTLRKWYSINRSRTNQLLDAFLGSLEAKILTDVRFLRWRHFELDAWFDTESGPFLVQVAFNARRLTEPIRILKSASKELRLRDPKLVLLFPLESKEPPVHHPNPRQITQAAEEGVVVRVVDVSWDSEGLE